MTSKLKARSKLGQYRILKKLGSGGFATVWEALDTVEGVHVAIKAPHDEHVDEAMLENFRKEVRTTAPLDHPNILPIKTATKIDGVFVIVSPLGIETLADRIERRLSVEKALAFADQLLAALAFAHQHKLIHCDIKPENLILFDADRLRLADFGIAKVAMRTLKAHGTGTFGYSAPEQAYGRPSFRSDVFAAGLIIYRMLTGVLPEWPFKWPLAGHARLKEFASSELIDFLRRTLEVDAQKRFPDAIRAHAAFRRLRVRALAHDGRRRARKRVVPRKQSDWKTVRREQFVHRFGKDMDVRHVCTRCNGPMSQEMSTCPWCGADHATFAGTPDFPASCPRCRRGVKSDWTYCPWCWGAAIGPLVTRKLADKRYAARCPNSACERKDLMPFMRYCPWCHEKVRRIWPLPGGRSHCQRCGWGVSREFWSRCPWCAAKVSPR